MAKRKQNTSKTTTGKFGAARKQVQAELFEKLTQAGLSQPVLTDGSTIVKGHARAAFAQEQGEPVQTFDAGAEALRIATQFLRTRTDATGCRAQAGGVWFSFGLEIGEDGKRYAVRRDDFLAGL
jgi:hypothetical protein